MAYCFYNGVRLPELPSEVLKNYPYCWIRKNDNTQHYDLLFTKILGYYDASTGGIVYGTTSGTTDIAHYRVAYPGNADDWTNYQTTNTWMALDANRSVVWSNHYIPSGSLTSTEMYFDGYEVIPETEAYQIQKDTVVAIADQVRRLCKTENTMTPAQIESNLGGLNIELMEAYVTSSEKDRVIYPDEGFYGFSKITVGGVDFGGGGGSAEDTTFGDNYIEGDVPTGNFDYSGGADENPTYIPEIPGDGEYKALFSMNLKNSRYCKFVYGGKAYEVQSDEGEFSVYFTMGHIQDDGVSGGLLTQFNVTLHCDKIIWFKTRFAPATTWSSAKRTDPVSGFPGSWYTLVTGTISGYRPTPDDLYTTIEGLPYFYLGEFADDTSYFSAMRGVATSGEDDAADDGQMIAFSSNTQILYDGSVINNMDGSPMTIYEVDANAENTWNAIGTTGGGAYPVGSYTLVWSSHDMMDMTGQYVTRSKSDDPIPEMASGVVITPVERTETYAVAGNTMNDLVSAAQKVTGSTIPLTPDEATNALVDYYNQPKAEEVLW